ncbi:STAS domain-containing protein [Spirochaetota bacterium]
MKIQSKSIDNLCIIYLPDEFEKQMLTDSLEEELNTVVQENINYDIIINMRYVKFISSLGLGILVRIVRELWNSGKKLHICSINNIINELLEIVNLRELVNIYDDEEEAVQSLTN